MAKAAAKGPIKLTPYYTKEVGDKICAVIAGGGTETEALEASEDMPTQHTVWRWREDNALFRLAYARARIQQTRSWADELVRLSKDATKDYIPVEGKFGGSKLGYNRDHVERVRLRIDTLRWLMAKINASEFSDKDGAKAEPLKDIQGSDLLGQIASIMADLGAALTDEQKAAMAAAIGADDE